MFATFQDWFLKKAIESESRKAGLSEHSLSLPCGDIRYLRRGHEPAGEAVLMLHGAAADRSAWIRFARYLKVGQPLVIPDLPGHGASCADAALSYGIAAQAGRVLAMLQALGIRRVHLVGNSMGGAIALHLAASHPHLVASLVLIGAVGVQARESWLQEHIRRTGRNPMIQIRTKHDYADMLRIGMEKAPAMPGFVMSALARQYMARLPLNEKIAHDIAPELERGIETQGIACPALIVWGRDDRVSHVANAELLHGKLRASRLRLLDGIGHVPMVEAPGWVAQLCNEFFAREVEAVAA